MAQHRGPTPGSRCQPKGDVAVKKEDIWMVVLVGFSILWTLLFGLGLFG